ncbi:hypothetical protein QEN19_000875 [Hanseniaspora menglaensis]
MSINDSSTTHKLSDADNFMLGLQNNIINRNTKIVFNENVDYMSNSRSNSSKKVFKPNNNISTSGSQVFDRSDDKRSNSYHFGNNNMNVNYWMNKDRGHSGAVNTTYNNGLNIYDDEEEEEEDEDDGAFDEDEAIIKNAGSGYNSQFIDLNTVKFNQSSGVNMKLDQIEDARGNTISKPINSFSDEFDNILLGDAGANNYMDFILNENDPNKNMVYEAAESNQVKFNDNNMFKNKNEVVIKPEIDDESRIIEKTFKNPTIYDDDDDEAVRTDFMEQKSSIDSIKKKKKGKLSHNIIEQKYRDNINEKILKFKELVPSLQYCSEKEEFLSRIIVENSNLPSNVYEPSPLLLKKLDGLDPAKKLSKSIILGKTFEYIEHLETKVQIYENLIKNYEQALNTNSNNVITMNDEKTLNNPIPLNNQRAFISNQQFIPQKQMMAKSNSSGSENGKVFINSGRNDNGFYQRATPQHQMHSYSQQYIPIPPQEIRGPSLYYDNIPINPILSSATSHTMSNSNNLSTSSMNSLSHYDSLQSNMLNTMSQAHPSMNKINSPMNKNMMRHPSNSNQFGGFFDGNSSRQ